MPTSSIPRHYEGGTTLTRPRGPSVIDLARETRAMSGGRYPRPRGVSRPRGSHRERAGLADRAAVDRARPHRRHRRKRRVRTERRRCSRTHPERRGSPSTKPRRRGCGARGSSAAARDRSGKAWDSCPQTATISRSRWRERSRCGYFSARASSSARSHGHANRASEALEPMRQPSTRH